MYEEYVCLAFFLRFSPLAFLGALADFFDGVFLSGKAFYAAFTALPKSRALSDIGKACYGNAGETTVRFFQYLYMSLVLIILHLTCAISLGRIIPGLCVVIYPSAPPPPLK